MRSTEVRAALLAAALAMAAATAHAHPPAYQLACKDDVKQFCANARFNTVKCMRAHAAELSDACKTAWLAHQKSASNAAEPEAQ